MDQEIKTNSALGLVFSSLESIVYENKGSFM